MSEQSMSPKERAVRQIHPSHKGWAKPGPLPDVDRIDEVTCDPGESIDALCGHWRIFQLADGHRFSTDDLLAAWYGSSWCPSARRVLDLGTGMGTVAMVVAWRLPGASIVGIEAQEVSVGLAKKSIEYNGLGDRFEVRLGDFREGALGKAERFDLITGSPPYFPLDAGVTSTHPQKVACRFEVRGDIGDYCRVASEHLESGGVFACVFPVAPEHQRARVERAAEAVGLMIVRWRPVALDERHGAGLGLFLMARSEDLPESMRAQTWVEPLLIIRRADRSLNPEYRAIKLSFGFPP